MDVRGIYKMVSEQNHFCFRMFCYMDNDLTCAKTGHYPKKIVYPAPTQLSTTKGHFQIADFLNFAQSLTPGIYSIDSCLSSLSR